MWCTRPVLQHKLVMPQTMNIDPQEVDTNPLPQASGMSTPKEAWIEIFCSYDEKSNTFKILITFDWCIFTYTEWDGFPLSLLKLWDFFFPFLVGCGPTPTYSTGTGAGTGGGFWSGAFTGGILGYMLGNNRNNYYAPGYTTPYSTGWGYNTPRASRGWFSSGSGLGSGFGGGSTSTGTRTASGFGGTKRRWIYLVWIDTAR